MTMYVGSESSTVWRPSSVRRAQIGVSLKGAAEHASKPMKSPPGWTNAPALFTESRSGARVETIGRHQQHMSSGRVSSPHSLSVPGFSASQTKHIYESKAALAEDMRKKILHQEVVEIAAILPLGTPEEFDELVEYIISDNSGLTGISNSLKIELDCISHPGGGLQYIGIVTYTPGEPHDTAAGFCNEVKEYLWENNWYFPQWPKEKIYFSGGADIKLSYNDRKIRYAPDSALTVQGHDFPFIIFEVANTQPAFDLDRKLRHYLLGSNGRIRYVVVIDLLTREKFQKMKTAEYARFVRLTTRDYRYTVEREPLRKTKVLRQSEYQSKIGSQIVPVRSGSEGPNVETRSKSVPMAERLSSHGQTPSYAKASDIHDAATTSSKSSQLESKRRVSLESDEECEIPPPKRYLIAPEAPSGPERMFTLGRVSVHTAGMKKDKLGNDVYGVIPLIEDKEFWPTAPPDEEGLVLDWDNMMEGNIPSDSSSVTENRQFDRVAVVPFRILHALVNLFFKNRRDALEASGSHPLTLPPGTQIEQSPEHTSASSRSPSPLTEEEQRVQRGYRKGQLIDDDWDPKTSSARD